jgi:2-amino-4-hydroxy-6-hydroxymethyldihydropteridine diphosphokinase
MRAYLSLGSNLGDRAGYLRRALDMLHTSPGIEVMRASGLYETAPVGELNQPEFLNLAAEIETVLEPLELLNACKTIERRLGRLPGPQWGPRTVDIDIVLYGLDRVAEETLEVPHPRFRERRFVLAPLAEIAPDAVDPVTQKRVAQLVMDPACSGAVRRLSDDTP